MAAHNAIREDKRFLARNFSERGATALAKAKVFSRVYFQSVALQAALRPWQNQTCKYISRAWRYGQPVGLGKLSLASSFSERGAAGLCALNGAFVSLNGRRRGHK